MNITIKIKAEDLKRKLDIRDGVDGANGMDGKNGVDGINGVSAETPTEEELRKIIAPLIPQTSGQRRLRVINQKVTPVTSGLNVLLTIPKSALEILQVFRDGQLMTPIINWTSNGNVITVLDSDNLSVYVVQYFK